MKLWILKMSLGMMINGIGFAQGAKQADMLKAIYAKNTKVVQKLLAKGFNANSRAPNGNTFLEEATQMGNVEIMKLFISKGADPNLGDGKWKPIFSAAQTCSHKKIAVLIKAGSKINIQADDGSTPLMKAAMGGETDDCLQSVKSLLKAGAKTTYKDKNGLDVFRYAYLHPKITKELKKAAK